MARGTRVITGGPKNSAAGARRDRGSGSKKPPLTHFLCIPLVTDSTRSQLEASLNHFRDLVATENGKACSNTNLLLRAIRPLGTIHFTLGVMSLGSVDRISEAIGFLQTIDLDQIMREIVQHQPAASSTSLDLWPLKTSLTSLHSMHPARRTSILYAAPEDPANVLLPFCVKIRDAFASAGFLVPDDRPLKLHATILNTIYAKAFGRKPTDEPSDTTSVATSSTCGNVGTQQEPTSKGDEEVPDRSHGHGPNARAPIRIDASELLEKCKDFVWAEDFTIENISICRMGAKKVLDGEGNVVDEQYEEIASIALPL